MGSFLKHRDALRRTFIRRIHIVIHKGAALRIRRNGAQRGNGEMCVAETICIAGGETLRGTISVQGSKNAALPVLAATLLHKGVSVLKNCPDIADVDNMLCILRHLGCRVKRQGHTVTVDAAEAAYRSVDGTCAGNMRGLVLFLGSMTGRFHRAQLPYPGGCVIGERPIDLHLAGLDALGVRIAEKEAYVCAEGRPAGGMVRLAGTSVGATENLLLAAACAERQTVIDGCALEPEIATLCRYLRKIGVQIKGVGTKQLTIEPLRSQRQEAVSFRIPGDRIVAGTCALAAVGCGGQIGIRGVGLQDLKGQPEVLQALGAKIAYDPEKQLLRVYGPEIICPIPYLETAPYPGFPTDLQSQLLAVLTKARGTSTIVERIFEQRFRIVEPLRNMGAAIEVRGCEAKVTGPRRLHGAHVEARELRGGAGLVIAGLMAEGNSEIGGVGYLRRGYENICRDFRMLGARIQ